MALDTFGVENTYYTYNPLCLPIVLFRKMCMLCNARWKYTACGGVDLGATQCGHDLPYQARNPGQGAHFMQHAHMDVCDNFANGRLCFLLSS
jgi:hypothetical protein